VWRVADGWAAGITATVLVCASPPTLHLLLSMTQHGPDWFCCALLAAELVVLVRCAADLSRRRLAALSLVVGILVGVDGASDVLVTIAGLAPFVVALLAAHLLARTRHTGRALGWAGATLVVVAVGWIATALLMSAWNVAPEPGLDTTKLAGSAQIATNLGLWWRGIVALGNGDHAAHAPALVACVPVIGGRELARGIGGRTRTRLAPDRLGLVVFWVASALALTVAFVFSGLPVDLHADRYLVGVVYAAAALLALGAARPWARRAVTAGACLCALSAIAALSTGAYTRNAGRFPSTGLSAQVLRVARAHDATVGYAGYWDAAPIMWATRLRLRVYPVSVCDQGQRLCRFDLHVITSWYRPRAGRRSFLLVDPALPLITGPVSDLGRAIGVYRIGRLTMYVYPYDLSARIVS
jgi:hypothetical protein